MKFQVVVASSFWSLSGVNIFAENLVRGLRGRGVDAHLLLTEQNSKLVNITDRLMPIPSDIPVEYLPVEPTEQWGAHWGAMIRYLEDRAPCIYVPNSDWRHSNICPLLSKKVSVVGVVHSDDPLHYDHVSRLGAYWDAVATVSKTVAEKTALVNQSVKYRIETIPIGVEVAESYPQRKFSKARPLKLIYHGLLIQRQKRILDLPKILYGMQQAGIPVELTIAGSGEQQEELLQACEPFVKSGAVHFLGLVPHNEILKILEQQDVFLMTSEFEGMPNAMLEAMGRGCVPVVTEISSGIPELIKEGETGYLIPIGDIQAFVDCFTRLQQTPELLQQVSANAYQMIRNGPYNVSQMVASYEKLFRRVLWKAKFGLYRRKRSSMVRPPSTVDGINIFPVRYLHNAKGYGAFLSDWDWQDFRRKLMLFGERRDPNWSRAPLDLHVIVGQSNARISGSNSFSENLCNGLRSKGIHAKVLLPDRHGSADGVETAAVDRLPFESSASLGAHWAGMIHYIEQSAPCVYLPNQDWKFSSVIPKLSPDVLVVGIVHSEDPAQMERALQFGRYWNVIVAVSQRVAQDICQRDPKLANKIIVIPYGVPVSKNPARTTSSDSLKLIYHGNLNQRQKRIFDLVKIMEMLEFRKIPVTLTIAGSGPDQEEFLLQSKIFIERGTMRFLENVSHQDVPALLAEQDLFLLPSKFEGMPHALLEAMSAGCIPIVSDVGSGIPELIQNEKNGFVIPPGNLEMFVQRISLLHGNSNLRKEMSSKAYESIRDGAFQSAVMVQSYIELFQALSYDHRHNRVTRNSGPILPAFELAADGTLVQVPCPFSVRRIGDFPSRADYKDFSQRISENPHRSPWLHQLNKKARKAYKKETRKMDSSFHEIERYVSDGVSRLRKDKAKIAKNLQEQKRRLRLRIKKIRRLGASKELLHSIKGKAQRTVRRRSRHKS